MRGKGISERGGDEGWGRKQHGKNAAMEEAKRLSLSYWGGETSLFHQKG